MANQPFIPEEDIPATKNFCVNTNRTIIGTTESEAPASCIGMFAPPLDWKNFRAAVRRCLDVLLMKRNGSTKLFQMLMKENSTTVAMAGPERGTKICAFGF